MITLVTLFHVDWFNAGGVVNLPLTKDFHKVYGVKVGSFYQTSSPFLI